MNFKFALLNNNIKTNDYITKLLINYPKKEYVLKNNIEISLYKSIELIFSYQINETNRIKNKYLKDLLINYSMLDYYIYTSYKKQIISKKRMMVVENFIIKLRKIIYGLMRNADM